MTFRDGNRHIGVAPAPRRRVVSYDASDLRADQHAIETLGRLQLIAWRVGGTIALKNTRSELVDLIELFGLSDVFVVTPASGSERRTERSRVGRARGQAEQREEVRVDEEVDP
jgi:hypothetical protein